MLTVLLMKLNPKALLARTFGLILRIALFAIVLAGPAYLFLANFAVFEPFLFPLHYLQGNVRRAGEHIIVGPYPDYGSLVALHERGVKIVISLLDPHLIYEKSLIRREDLLAKQIGIKEYNFPMNSGEPPTSVRNLASLRHIRQVIRTHPKTTIYIHCYLGKHRVGYVVAMLKKESGAPAGPNGHAPVLPADRGKGAAPIQAYGS